MKNFRCQYYFAVLLLMLMATACSKNITYYYPDDNTAGAAIFSNTGNNLMTCFTNGQSWRTMDRITGYMGRSELEIRRFKTASPLDTITITWTANSINFDHHDIRLTLPVEKTFTWKDISRFAGKRITIDSTNGYFSLVQNSFYNYANGKGTIYFNTAYIDSTSPSNIKGRLSGLFQSGVYVTFGNPDFTNITSGRFDEDITGFELRNY